MGSARPIDPVPSAAGARPNFRRDSVKGFVRVDFDGRAALCLGPHENRLSNSPLAAAGLEGMWETFADSLQIALGIEIVEDGVRADRTVQKHLGLGAEFAQRAIRIHVTDLPS